MERRGLRGAYYEDPIPLNWHWLRGHLQGLARPHLQSCYLHGEGGELVQERPLVWAPCHMGERVRIPPCGQSCGGCQYLHVCVFVCVCEGWGGVGGGCVGVCPRDVMCMLRKDTSVSVCECVLMRTLNVHVSVGRCMCACLCACTRARAYACVHASAGVCACVCTHPCVTLCMYVCVRVCAAGVGERSCIWE